MVGQGYVIKCPACGHEEELLFGRGYITDTQAFLERENILTGEYGPKAKAALEAYPEATVTVEQAPFQCGGCGALDHRNAVKVNAPVRVPILQRCDCGATMHRIRRNEKVICPACGEPMAPTDEMIRVLWD